MTARQFDLARLVDFVSTYSAALGLMSDFASSVSGAVAHRRKLPKTFPSLRLRF
jgi:hypothetical protein